MSISNHQSPISRIGVLGGTFDPPHHGHLLIARQAFHQLKLNQVLFAPAHQPPHKIDQSITPIRHRLEMVRLAIADQPGFVLSRIDVDRQGPTFTVDTMRLLRQQFGEASTLYFIMGMDSLMNILTWHAPEQLIQVCKLAVFARPGFRANIGELEKQLPGLRERIVFLSTPTLNVAASELQKRVRDGQSIEDCVPKAVAKYIEENGLYKNS
jgi:nicotinate-nucleotide adenylyltransferase